MKSPCRLGPNSRLFLLLLVVCTYLVCGALIFSSLEEKYETGEVKAVQQKKLEFMNKMRQCDVSDDDLENFLSEVVKASEYGILITNNVTFNSSWTFGQSLFFVSTLLTTIGYGHTLPLSYGGKIFALFYCMFGMPLILIMYSVIVARLLTPLTTFQRFLKRKMVALTRESNIELVHFGIVSLIVLIFFFFIPAAIFTFLEEDWNYLDSFYYCFISLTTIGLGDYIPGEGFNQPYRAIYKICVAVYLLVGLVCMMTLMGVLYNIHFLNLSVYFLPPELENADMEEERLTSNEPPTNYTKENNSTGESNS